MKIVSKDNKYGCIDENGKGVIPCTYDKMTGINLDERIAVKKDGKEIIPIIYDSLDSFREGLAVVGIGEPMKSGFINKKGEIVIPCEYSSARPFKEGYAAVYTDKWRKIDKEENLREEVGMTYLNWLIN